MKPLSLMLLLLLLFSSPTSAVAEPPNVSNAYAGAGTLTCGSCLEHSDKPALFLGYMSWIRGFLSGLNLGFPDSGPGIVTLPNPDAIKHYMNSYCQANPF